MNVINMCNWYQGCSNSIYVEVPNILPHVQRRIVDTVYVVTSLVYLPMHVDEIALLLMSLVGWHIVPVSELVVTNSRPHNGRLARA